MLVRLIFGLFALTSLASLGACRDEDADAVTAFREALPDDVTLDVELPDPIEVTEAGLEIHEGALVGDESRLRRESGLARDFLRGALPDLLDGFRDITALRPIVRERDRAVWWSRSADRMAEHLLVMLRDPDDGHFTFTSWVRERSVARAWRFLAFGTVTPGETSGDGRGAAWINLENDRKDRTKGKVVALWSEQGARRDLDVRAFEAASGESEPRRTRGYRFHEDERGGTLAFDLGLTDVHRDPALPGLELVRVITRWDDGRRFRSDATAIGPEIGGAGYRAFIDSQCWRAPSSAVLYERRLALGRDGEADTIGENGDLDACPFARAETPVLPSVDAPPDEPDAPPETDPDRDWGD